ncbi:RraA family protein [Neolewinella sp.]|uniref:RraA family protein n=1 Tax=Neolewinella sp. TaxID=2993543 RepID=UPI003B516755
MNRSFYFICLIIWVLPITGQQITPNAKEIQALTSQWTGERFADGRPKTPDALLARLANVSLEEAWGVLRNEGYHNQYEGDWMVLHPEQVMVGRAVTAQYMPLRPAWNEMIKAQGEADGRIGGTNSWPIDILSPGDIYVADGYGKVIDGTLIGDNLGNSIYAKSQNGVIFNGSVRDVEGLEKIEGFNAWIKGYDPSYIQEMQLASINAPIRLGRATVLPGDVILAKRLGIIVIPPHLLERVVVTAEFVALRDAFGHQRLREGKYTPGEIDREWTADIKTDFMTWIEANPDRLPMSRTELDAYLAERNW